MKKVNILFTILTLTISAAIPAQEQVNCGNDYNCYYEQKAQQEQLEKNLERQEENTYRERQLELQEDQLQEVQENRLFMEQQQQAQDADRYEKMPEE